MQGTDIEVVITSYNQREMILEALDSVCHQTILPAGVIIVDDGSTDEQSRNILTEIEKGEMAVPVLVYRQENSGVSAARNKGISLASKSYVLVLDGDDRLKENYIEEVGKLLEAEKNLVAASSWMQTFGVLESIVKPMGGAVTSFLAKNACPATHILRKEAWQKCGGYDESMRSGSEDWDF